MDIEVKVKSLQEGAKVPFKTYDDDFCYDVVATSEKEIAPNVWEYGIGLAFEIVRPVDNNKDIKLSIDFRPRSSVWKTGMVLSNCEGTIDETYRGEVKAIFYHVMPNMPRYKIGDKIGQIKLGATLPMKFNLVSDLNMNTDRGEGGFGSTGK